MADVVAFENCKLLLAQLVCPWLGDDETEGVLRAVLAIQRPAVLVEAALRDILGLAANAPVSLPFVATAGAEPKGSWYHEDFPRSTSNSTVPEEQQAACGTCGSAPSQGMESATASGVSVRSAICDKRMLESLPLRLIFANDFAQRAAVRRTAEHKEEHIAHTEDAAPLKPSSHRGAGMQCWSSEGIATTALVHAHACAPEMCLNSSRVTQVVHAEPGMRSPHVWWAAASAALWDDFLGGREFVYKRLCHVQGENSTSIREVKAHAPCANLVGAAGQQQTDSQQILGILATGSSQAIGDPAAWMSTPSRHDVSLLLQRTVLVAMVCIGGLSCLNGHGLGT
jgi:hypothetical protein